MCRAALVQERARLSELIKTILITELTLLLQINLKSSINKIKLIKNLTRSFILNVLILKNNNRELKSKSKKLLNQVLVCLKISNRLFNPIAFRYIYPLCKCRRLIYRAATYKMHP